MKFKAIIVFAFFVCSVLSAYSIAQDKVVVIPLWSDSGDGIPTVTSNGQVWMDRNLGSPKVAESSIDFAAFGWLYQWGRLPDGHEIWRIGLTTIELSGGDVPGNPFFIIPSSTPWDWRNPQNPNLWQGVSGINNPCPSGFRLPTIAEWETEMSSWTPQNATGAFASPLKLVAVGYRSPKDGTIKEANNQGRYWSSTVAGYMAHCLAFGSDFADTTDCYTYRAAGFSVRCIKD